MSVIVTGVAGFIGSHLTEKLIEDGYEVIGIDNFHSYYSRRIKERNLEHIRKKEKEYDGIMHFFENTIMDKDFLRKIRKKFSNFSYIFHFAAVAGVRYSIENPEEYFRVNTTGTLNMLLTFREADKFIFASSSSVYGDVPEKNLPVSENYNLNPISPYALSKKHAEEIVSMLSEIHNLPYTILRYFSVYGPRQRPDEVFTKFIVRALKEQPLEVYGDGKQKRDFTYISDIVKGTILAAEKGDGVYNIGTGRRVDVITIIEILREILGDVKVTYLPKAPGDVRNTEADIKKAKKELGYVSEIKMEEGTERCV